MSNLFLLRADFGLFRQVNPLKINVFQITFDLTLYLIICFVLYDLVCLFTLILYQYSSFACSISDLLING